MGAGGRRDRTGRGCSRERGGWGRGRGRGRERASGRKVGRKARERGRERRREEAVRVKVDGDREGKEGVEEGRLCGSNEERERKGDT